MYINRTLEGFFGAAGRQFPVLLVSGARQVGKTTFLKYMNQGEREYVTLDDPLVLDLARNDPALFMQRFEPPLIIDEIQYAPELLPYIKMAVDENRKPGMFWLTGSQQFHLMKGVSESLAGRVAVINLLGFSRREMMQRGRDADPFLPLPADLRARCQDSGPLGLKALYHLIWRGSFPAIATDAAMDRELFYSSYVQTYLQRDIRDLARVGDEMAFLRFLRAAAARSGQMLNMADMARDAGVAPNTAKSWLSILQASGIIYLLAPYSTNITKRLLKTPKLYFLDTGLCTYLTGWSSPETLEAGAMSGAVLETWIMAELLKSYCHNGRQPPFFYYRDKDRKEIDLLILRDDTIYPLEFKKTASADKKDIRHFSALNRLGKEIGPGGVISLVRKLMPLTGDIMAIPVAAL